MKKSFIGLSLLVCIALILSGCSSSSSSSSNSGNTSSGIKFRAFVSENVSAGSSAAGLYLVNAQIDTHPVLSPISAGNTPGMMVVTPNRVMTLVFSGNNLPSSDNTFNVINNATEANGAHLTLPGATESFVVSPDSSTAYVAVPTAKVNGQDPGLVEVVSISTTAAAFNGQVNIPSVRYLTLNNGGDRMLAFADKLVSLAAPCTDPTPSFVFLIRPSGVNIDACPITPIPGVNFAFDYPVAAFFSSDDTTAFVINCGAECGGTQASVQKIEMTPASCLPDGVCKPVPVPASTVGLVDGETMYLAGTPYTGGVPSQACTGQTTAATTCGLLTVFNLNTMSVTNTGPIVITDGFHNRIALGANGQLYIGARTCTEIIPPQPPPKGAEVRGCLSVYNTLGTAVGSVPAGGVLIPSANGDVTGLQPVATRTVVYVVQGGTFTIYDDTTDALAVIPNNPTDHGHIPNLIGNFVDVKTVDF